MKHLSATYSTHISEKSKQKKKVIFIDAALMLETGSYKNYDKIDWFNLSANQNALELLKVNPDKINLYMLMKNPLLFKLDYKKIRENFQELKEEIIAKALHPKRIFKLIELYGEEEIYNNYFDD